MSVMTHPIPGAVPAVPRNPALWRMSVDQYHRMIQTGILTEDDLVELLQGYVVEKSPTNPRHSQTSEMARDRIAGLLPAGYCVASQEPITTDDSEPEPDLSVIRGTRRQYLEHHPYPENVVLLIEVAGTSLNCDRSEKKRIYARARIPVYWIINIADRTIEVYTLPTGPDGVATYRKREPYGAEDEIPLVIDGQEAGRFRVAEALP